MLMLLMLVMLGVLMPSSQAVRCYLCTSLTSTDCGDQFTSTSLTCNGVACFKAKTQINGRIIIYYFTFVLLLLCRLYVEVLSISLLSYFTTQPTIFQTEVRGPVKRSGTNNSLDIPTTPIPLNLQISSRLYSCSGFTTKQHSFHRRIRSAYVYNGCLAWYNVVLTPRIHSTVKYSQLGQSANICDVSK